MRKAAVLIAMIVPVLAFANGGPVAWTGATGTGDLAPIQNGQVSLVSEELRIVLDDDGRRFNVAARYELSNPGPKTKVKYGVPLFWYPPDLGDVDGDEVATKRRLVDPAVARYPAQVRIAVGGRSFPCRFEGTRPVDDEKGVHVAGWCVADVEIPAGEHGLTLHYTGQLRFVDMAFTKSPFTEHERRSFLYELSPAGHWAGRTRSLDVEIETGIWRELFHVEEPSGFVTDGSRLRLRLADVDLKALGAIRGELDAAPVLGHRERAGTKADRALVARASAALASRGRPTYGAANVLDGKPSTAWCVRTPRRGVGEWIELRAKELAVPPHCGLAGYVLVPGYAKDQRSWDGNNRVRSVRLENCGTELEPGEDLEFRVARRHDTSAVELHRLASDPLGVYSGDEPRRVEDYCVRLRILAVEGAAEDTCIAEFQPVLNCS